MPGRMPGTNANGYMPYNDRCMRPQIIAFCLASAALAQAPEFLKKSTFEEVPALQLSNDKLELTVLATGGALANLVLRDDPQKLSPFWNPKRYARETGKKHNGTGMGHFVCVDGFGPVSPEEKEAGLPGHGEAHDLPWETKFSRKEGAAGVLTQTVKLPILQETFTRTLRMVDGENVIYVQSELQNLLGFDRPVNWGEHATIGSPFLEPGVTVVDMPAKRAQTRPAEPGVFPNAAALGQRFHLAHGAHGRRQKSGPARRSGQAQFSGPYDLSCGSVTQAGVGDGAQFVEENDPGICFSPRGLPVDTGVGILLAGSPHGARPGVRHAALRRAAARNGGDTSHV